MSRHSDQTQIVLITHMDLQAQIALYVVSAPNKTIHAIELNGLEGKGHNGLDIFIGGGAG